MSLLTLTAWRGMHALLRGTSIAVLLFMMLSIFYDTVMRYLFSAPTSWSLEINSFLIVYMAVMGAAEAQRAQATFESTCFLSAVPTGAKPLSAF